jgi:hypothetical protein
MNKTHLCVLPLTLFLAASSGYSVAQETEHANGLKCEGDPQAPMVTLNLNTMKAKPECVHARPGTTIVFRLVPKKGLDLKTVKVLPEDSFDSWLQGKNDEFDDVIMIRVPGVYKPDDEGTDKPTYSNHDYTVEIADQKIDPRVEVQH